jgi:methionyl-tRNA formyltransferase
MEKEAKRGKAISSELPRLIFLGTPEFAVPSLKKLMIANAPVLLVVTQPDRPCGRGKKLSSPPVKIAAESFGIPVYQPERIREKGAIEHVRSYEAECAVVVAYGQIFPQAFLDAFTLGALNVHGSLLPAFRGAAPIQRCLLAGEAMTGISIMLLDAGMDTGPILSQRELPLDGDESFGTLHNRLAQLGADLLVETLKEWQAGRVMPVPQEDSLATYAPPILKSERRVVWDMPARQIVNLIRAFDPSPGAHGFFQGQRLKFFKAGLLSWKGDGRPGEIVGCSERGLVVLGGDGLSLAIGELQLEGQRRMAAAEFIRGHAMPVGSMLD